jgi:hypothetical protein
MNPALLWVLGALATGLLPLADGEEDDSLESENEEESDD